MTTTRKTAEHTTTLAYPYAKCFWKVMAPAVAVVGDAATVTTDGRAYSVTVTATTARAAKAAADAVAQLWDTAYEDLRAYRATPERRAVDLKTKAGRDLAYTSERDLLAASIERQVAGK